MKAAVYTIIFGSILPLAGCSDQRNPPPPPPNQPAVEEHRAVETPPATENRPAVETHAPGVDVKAEKGNVEVKAPGVDVDVERNKNK
jgi:hypothetical protein